MNCKKIWLKSLFDTLVLFPEKMPRRTWRAVKVAEITYHELNSKLRISGTASDKSPILLGSDTDVRETIEHHK